MNSVGTDWLADLAVRERELERDVARLRIGAPAGDELAELWAAERLRLQRRIQARVAQMRALLDDCLCGRSECERSAMLYQARLLLSLYSHLSRIMDMEVWERN